MTDIIINKILSYVSRETFESFHAYFNLIQKWNRKTFLVQEKTLDDFMERHVLDSLQLQKYLPNKSAKIMDIGAGAGFPGMVLAMNGYDNITLCDSNAKKCIFLKEVSRETNTKVKIVNKRVEEIEGEVAFEVVISRACASLAELLEFMSIVGDHKTKGIFLKGQKIDIEIAEAKKKWRCNIEKHSSETSDSGTIVLVSNLLPIIE